MMYGGGHMGTGGWIFAILGTIIVLALVVGAIVWIASELSRRRDGEASAVVPPSDVLNRRLSSGEITAEQHEQLRRRLEPTSSRSDSNAARRAGVSG